MDVQSWNRRWGGEVCFDCSNRHCMVCLGRSVFSPGSNPWRWWCSLFKLENVCRTVTALSRGQFRPKNIPALSCFYEAGQPAFCRTDSFSIQGWSVLTPLSVGNNFLWLLRSSRGIILAHLRRPRQTAHPDDHLAQRPLPPKPNYSNEPKPTYARHSLNSACATGETQHRHPRQDHTTTSDHGSRTRPLPMGHFQ